jgi:RNA polymerase sigma-70 factor, ECF subfamily
MLHPDGSIGMGLFQFGAFKRSFSLLQAEDFSRFYAQAHLSVFRYGMALCGGDAGEAEEITAEAFLRAWEKRALFSGSESAALGWVITIARNLLINRRRRTSDRPAEILLDEAVPAPERSIEALLIDADQLERVLAAIQALPFPQGDILTLRYVLGWQVKAIAAHLGMAENTVSVNLRRALAKVQAQLAPQDASAGRTV